MLRSWRKEDVLAAIDKIIRNDITGLDIVQMENKKWYFRCRIGKLRIIFFEKNGSYHIDKVGYRWDVYK